MTRFFFSTDAKLNKKCTLLDISQRPIEAAPDTQGTAALIGEANNPDPHSSPRATPEHLRSECDEEMKEEKQEEEVSKEKEEESFEQSPTRMEMDQTESQLVGEQSMASEIWTLCLV